MQRNGESGTGTANGAPGGGSTAGDGPPDRIAVGRAAIILVVAVVVAILVLPSATRSPLKVATSRTTVSTTTTTTQPTTPTSSTTSTTLGPPRPSITVLVANGVGGVGAYAGDITRVLSSDGYKTEPAENATKTVTASAVYTVGSGTAAEAREVASDLQLPASNVQPVAASAPVASSTGADVVVIVGPDLKTRIDDGSLTIPSTTTTSST